MRTMIIMHGLSSEQRERLDSIAPGWRIIQGKEKELWQPHLRDAEIVAGWNDTAAQECLLPEAKLRWVQCWGAGVDWLPLQAFADKGVLLTSVSGVHAYPISETIFAMMLSLTRKLHVSIRKQINKQWSNPGSLGEIHGKTMGIIGVGAIGEETARLAKAFHMRVLGVRRSGEPSPFVDRMYDLQGLHEVLAESDYVIVTLPLTTETRHLFRKAEFEAMKPSAYFINMGRGGTADTEALLHALNSGRIAGAGLDVFEQEPLPADHPLWELEQVIITPHNAGLTTVYNERAFEIFARNLQNYIEERELSANLVDLAKQY
ncbi:D-2-hydroxyacid dehydrogenase [Paenibacillus sp. NPDC056579]|uniref:D-2-hydroxyacid dehydrogenase n=1 Tax=Paenibacillus sp. NPDC056579 TaxID=3345871 RepID=UPI0036C41A56